MAFNFHTDIGGAVALSAFVCCYCSATCIPDDSLNILRRNVYLFATKLKLVFWHRRVRKRNVHITVLTSCDLISSELSVM